MDSHFPATREDLYHVQMDVKHVQVVQSDHSDRLLRLERRQAADAALKSVWTSPFPSVLSGTPQQGPVQTPSADVFDDFDDEQGHNLLGGLSLESEGEPVRRGASRANSVRFDVSALQGSNWSHASRNSGDFGLIRPGSGMGSHPMTERSSSHKSDGRHSSAGHSVHSMQSGRTSSLGLDTNFMIGGQDDDSPVEIPGPPPGLFILGSVPSIIRCWLDTNFTHSTLLYAVVCTGSQKSLLDYSLVKELGLVDELQRNLAGTYYIRLPVYLPEAVVTQPSSRSNSPAPQLPTLAASFEVTGVGQRESPERKKGLRIFLGSDTLRAHSADLLFSQNLMTLYGEDRNKISVPFVRPEDDSLFKNLCTTNLIPERNELKATAMPFTPTDQKPKSSKLADPSIDVQTDDENSRISRSNTISSQRSVTSRATNGGDLLTRSEAALDGQGYNESESSGREMGLGDDQQDSAAKPTEIASHEEPNRRESGGGIWSSWRKDATSTIGDVNREGASSYQKAGRGGRSMKVLKPSKPVVASSSRSSSGARTGAAYEPVPRPAAEGRRKSQVATTDSMGAALRWEPKRVVLDDKSKDLKNIAASLPSPSMSRSSNPIGGATAFAWMNSGKPKTNTAAVE